MNQNKISMCLNIFGITGSFEFHMKFLGVLRKYLHFVEEISPPMPAMERLNRKATGK